MFFVYLAPSSTTHLSPPKAHSPKQLQRTPLHLAASEGHEAVCRVLIEAGAKVDA